MKTMHRMARSGIAVVLAGATAACAGGTSGEDTGAPAPPSLPSAPWSAAPVSVSSVPHAYVDAWSDAANREQCALLAITGVRSDADPRVATFAGGWGVAYDLPDQRSAFGIAGTGVSVGGDTYDDWPYRIEWRDGSTAEYGPEGGTGPNQLAYLHVAGEECLYNVWSRLGRNHLEALLARVRRVSGV